MEHKQDFIEEFCEFHTWFIAVIAELGAKLKAMSGMKRTVDGSSVVGLLGSDKSNKFYKGERSDSRAPGKTWHQPLSSSLLITARTPICAVLRDANIFIASPYFCVSARMVPRK